MTHTARSIIFTDEGDHGYSAALDAIGQQPGVELLSGAKLAADTELRLRSEDRLIITSENTLEAALASLEGDPRAEAIRNLKDKFRCRELLRGIYPEFYFRRVSMADIARLELPPGRTFVIKPNRGYFATAVKIVDSSSDLIIVAEEITQEVQRNAVIFPNAVLSDTEVIVEEYIEGEEYAVDMFYDSRGEPVVVNIYHHPIPKNPDYLHVLYYSSAEIFEAIHDRICEWFRVLNETLQVKSFPVHGEFRYQDGYLCPVELNPLRYGGDGLCDLALHAYGENPYAAFFEDRAFDWGSIWQSRPDKIYAWMMGYNGSDIDVSTHRPDRRQFQNKFSNILSDTVLNYQHHLAFSVVYVEEENIESIEALVNTDFRELFLGSEAWSDETFWTLYRAGVRAHYPTGTHVWHKADSGDHVLLILEGQLDVLARAASGEEYVFDSVGPKSVLGEYSAIDGLPRSATVRSHDDCTVMRISGPAFRRLLRQSPEIFEDLYWQQVLRVRRMNDRLMELLSAADPAGPGAGVG